MRVHGIEPQHLKLLLQVLSRALHVKASGTRLELLTEQHEHGHTVMSLHLEVRAACGRDARAVEARINHARAHPQTLSRLLQLSLGARVGMTRTVALSFGSIERQQVMTEMEDASAAAAAATPGTGTGAESGIGQGAASSASAAAQARAGGSVASGAKAWADTGARAVQRARRFIARAHREHLRQRHPQLNLHSRLAEWKILAAVLLLGSALYFAMFVDDSVGTNNRASTSASQAGLGVSMRSLGLRDASGAAGGGGGGGGESDAGTPSKSRRPTARRADATELRRMSSLRRARDVDFVGSIAAAGGVDVEHGRSIPMQRRVASAKDSETGSDSERDSLIVEHV